MTAIPLARRLPGASSNLPERLIRTDLAPEGAAPFLFGLAPGGVCRAAAVAGSAVRSYRTVSPLPRRNATRRGGLFSVALSLRPAPRGAPAGRYPAPLVHGARTFLSGRLSACGAERPSGRLTAEEWGRAAPASSGLARGSRRKKARVCREGDRPGCLGGRLRETVAEQIGLNSGTVPHLARGYWVSFNCGRRRSSWPSC